MTERILIRHGLTEHNATRRFQGQGDVPLNVEPWAARLLQA